MTTVGYATLDVIPTVKGLRKQLDGQMSNELGAAGKRGGKKYGEAAGTSAASDFKGKFSAGMKGFAPLAGLALGAGAVAIFKGAIDGAREAAQVSRVTAKLIETTGGAAQITAGQVSDLAGRMMDYAAVDDEVVQAGANVLLTFKNVKNAAGEGNDIFNRAIKSGLDLSTVLGGDISSSALQLGKALNDPIKGLTVLGRAGVQFTADQKEQIKAMVGAGDLLSAQKIILSEVEGQVGGAAGAAADDTARLGVAMGNLQEALGGAVLPAMEMFSKVAVNDVIPAIETAGGVAADAVGAFRSLPEPVQAATAAFVALKLASAAGLSFPSLAGVTKSIDGLRLRTMLAGDAFREARAGSVVMRGGLETAVGPAGRLSASLKGVSTFATGAGTALKRGLGGAVSMLGGPWGIAIGAGVALLAKFISGQRAAKQHVEDVTAALDQQTGAITKQNEVEAFNALQKKGIIGLANKYNLSLDDVRKASLGNADAAARLNDELKRQAAAYQTAGEVASGGDSLVFAEDAQKIAAALGTEQGALRSSQAEFKARKEFMSTSSDAQKDLTGTTGAYTTAIIDAKNALQGLIEKEQKRALAAVQAKRDEIALLETIKATRKETREGKQTLDETTAAGRKNWNALLDLADQWNNSKAKVQNARGAYKEIREEFVRNADQMGKTKAEAEKLADKLLKVPKNASVEFRSKGYLKMLQEIRDLRKAAKAIYVPLIYSNKPKAPNMEAPVRRASGGAVFGAGTSTSDSIPAWLSNGEFVQRTRAVNYYGLDFMKRLNNLQIPKFASGGPVAAAPASSSGGGPGLVIDQRGATFQVADYRDFMQQTQRRAEASNLSGVRS